MRSYTALLVALLALFAARPAEAYLGYSYIELNGAPVLDYTRNNPSFEGRPADFSGFGWGAKFSIAVHKYFHLWSVYNYENEEDRNFLGLNNLGIKNKLTSQRQLAAVAPHFNYTVFKKGDIQVDVLLGIGLQYAHSKTTLKVEDEKDKDKEHEFGVLVRGGTRAMIWRGLELHADMIGSNIQIIENEIFFNVGARYHFLRDMFDLGIAGGFGTDDSQVLLLSGRLYYDKIWHALTD